jgi:hypothetical protein
VVEEGGLLCVLLGTELAAKKARGFGVAQARQNTRLVVRLQAQVGHQVLLILIKLNGLKLNYKLIQSLTD